LLQAIQCYKQSIAEWLTRDNRGTCCIQKKFTENPKYYF